MKKIIAILMMFFLTSTMTMNATENELLEDVTPVEETTSEVVEEETTVVEEEEVEAPQPVSTHTVAVETSRGDFTTRTVAISDDSLSDYGKSVNNDLSSKKSSSGLEDFEVSSLLRSEQPNTEYTVTIDGVEITYYNNKIVAINNGIVRTNGGTSQVLSMYSTLEDYNSKSDPIPLSGAGYDGFYLDTIKQGDEYVIHFTIGGGDFYINSNDVTIIPFADVKAVTHYEVIDGNWYLREAVDALTSTEYTDIYLDDAPSWAEAGVNYYTIDGYNFYTTYDEMVADFVNPNSRSASNHSMRTYNYFQNLPFRSSSAYTTLDYKNYLKSKGFTNSQYYGTSAFVKAQEEFNVNSLLMFAFSNHESFYGTSTYAYRCNNFYGRGAYDSNPDNACIEYGFNTAYDGILAEAIFLSNTYLYPESWVYNGTHFGDKTSGMNVKYASDPNWGSKNASQAKAIDSYLGGSEEYKFKIIKVPGFKQIYKNAGLTTKMLINNTSGGTVNYMTGQNDSSNSSSSMWGTNHVVRSEGSGYYQIQLDTPLNISGTSTCRYRTAMKGSYPNYNGYTDFKVAAGVGDNACEYEDWSSQYGYISKSGVKVINDVKIVTPEYHADDYNYGTCNILTETTTFNGNVVEYYRSSSNNKECRVEYYGTSNDIRYRTYDYFIGGGEQHTQRIINRYDKNGERDWYQKYLYRSNGSKISYESTYYNTKGEKTSTKFYNYDSNDVRYRRVQTSYANNVVSLKKWFTYDSSGQQLQRLETYKYVNGKKKYYADTYYDSYGIDYYKEYWYDLEKGFRYARNEKYYTKGKAVNAKKSFYSNNGKTRTRVENTKYSSGRRTYFSKTYYNSYGIDYYYEYFYNSSGVRIQRNEKYYINGNASYKKYVYYDDNGNYKNQTITYY